MAVTPDEVRRIAELARLELAPDEAEQLVDELNGILEHVDALQAVDLEGGEDGAPSAGTLDAGPPSASTEAEPARLRADEPGADPLLIPPGELAVGWRDGYFTVATLEPHRRTK